MFASDFEERLYEERKEKLKRIEALGVESGLKPLEATYPNSFRTTHELSAIQAEYNNTDAPVSTEALEADRVEVTVAGRVMAHRRQGKAGFAVLQGNGSRLQIYVRKDDVGERAFELYKLLDLGDHIGVSGHLFRTRTGELTVHVQTLTFLAKAMLALPDKFHGLTDIELRYRQRYLDLFMDNGEDAEVGEADPSASLRDDKGEGMRAKPEISSAFDATGAPGSPKANLGSEAEDNPEALAAATAGLKRLPARDVFVKRAQILKALRKFFDARGYVEVETPMMQPVAGGAAARPFVTHHNTMDMDLYLRIAPELYLKRLVVGGMDRVYEINRNFRNEGISTQHNPEFTMLEFYQAYSNYHDLMDLTEELITFVAKKVNNGDATITFPVPKGFHSDEVRQVDLSKWQRCSMKEAILEHGKAGSPIIFENSDDFVKFLEVNASFFEEDAVRLQASSDKIKDRPRKTTNGFPPSYYTLQGQQDERLSWAMFKLAWQSAFRKGQAKQLRSIRDQVVRSGVNGKVISDTFEIICESELIQPTIIYDFPLGVSPLSKVKPDEPEWVERFEFYIGGFEVGNAFSELNDPEDQRRRFEAQLGERERGDDQAHQMDADYVRALAYGLPPTAGEGIGIDRLTMLLTGSRSIRDVILFPLLRPAKQPVLEKNEQA